MKLEGQYSLFVMIFVLIRRESQVNTTAAANVITRSTAIKECVPKAENKFDTAFGSGMIFEKMNIAAQMIPPKQAKMIRPLSTPNFSCTGIIKSIKRINSGKIRRHIKISSVRSDGTFLMTFRINIRITETIQAQKQVNAQKKYFSRTYSFGVMGSVIRKAYPLSASSYAIELMERREHRNVR